MRFARTWTSRPSAACRTNGQPWCRDDLCRRNNISSAPISPQAEPDAREAKAEFPNKTLRLRTKLNTIRLRTTLNILRLRPKINTTRLRTKINTVRLGTKIITITLVFARPSF